MKRINKLFMFIFVLISLSAEAQAAAEAEEPVARLAYTIKGNGRAIPPNSGPSSGKGDSKSAKEVGNGGDSCELLFESIRLDLIKWFDQGGGEDLPLPPDIPRASYVDSMKYYLDAVRLSCVDEKVAVDGVDKTCKNEMRDGVPTVVCNVSRTLQTSETGEDQLYKIFHHEIAGLAGFEVTVNGRSDYSLSDQIAGSLVWKTVPRLAVKRAVHGPDDDPLNCKDLNVEEYSRRAALKIIGENANKWIKKRETRDSTRYSWERSGELYRKQSLTILNGPYDFTWALPIVVDTGKGKVRFEAIVEGEFNPIQVMDQWSSVVGCGMATRFGWFYVINSQSGQRNLESNQRLPEIIPLSGLP